MQVRPSAAIFHLLLVASIVTGTSRSSALGSQFRRTSEPSERTLTTNDGVLIRISYYPGKEGEETTPVILLHDYEESRAEYASLAKYLQNPAAAGVADAPTRAVVTVDLRGHGDSKTFIGRDGLNYEMDASRFRQADFQNMVLFDLEEVRQFLIGENDAKALNLNKLCVLGAGMGANVAVTWTARDWAMPPLAARKQGQDIKGMVLLSPTWDYQGLPLAGPLRQPDITRDVALMLVYGAENRNALRDAKNILKYFEPNHPELASDRFGERNSLVEMKVDTALQGTALINDRNTRQFGVVPQIDRFIRLQLDNKSFAWMKRRLD